MEVIKLLIKDLPLGLIKAHYTLLLFGVSIVILDLFEKFVLPYIMLVKYMIGNKLEERFAKQAIILNKTIEIEQDGLNINIEADHINLFTQVNWMTNWMTDYFDTFI